MGRSLLIGKGDALLPVPLGTLIYRLCSFCEKDQLNVDVSASPMLDLQEASKRLCRRISFYTQADLGDPAKPRWIDPIEGP